MTCRVLVFAEDFLGMTLARDLCDRVVVERGPAWLADLWRDANLRATQRQWSGVDPGDPWTTWYSAREIAAALRVRPHGLGLRGYALAAYRTALVAAKLSPRPDLVAFCIDTQGNETMRADILEALEQVRVDDMPILLAVAHQESESWVVSGFVAKSSAEQSMLRGLESEHGFNPTLEPHRLTPNRQTDPHDAKRVCASLFPAGTRAGRAQQCWLDTSLEVLERHGARTGLPDYLADTARMVLPLVGGRLRGS